MEGEEEEDEEEEEEEDEELEQDEREDERSPPKVPPKKADMEVAKKKKDKGKGVPPCGYVSFAVSGKGPHISLHAASTRGEKCHSKGGYDHNLDMMQRILEMHFNINLGRLVMHYKDCPSEEPKSRQEIRFAVLLHTGTKAPNLLPIYLDSVPTGCEKTHSGKALEAMK